MKKIIKLLLPPLFLKLWRHFQKKDPVNITYEGVYQSFDMAKNAYSFTTRYNSKESLLEIQANASKKYKLYHEGKVPSLEWSNSRLNLFPIFVSAMQLEGKITILDIGGGLGDSFIDLKYSCPELELDYYIYDLPEVIALGNEFQKSFPGELNFINDFSSIEPTIVLFGSSLQYFENYSDILKKVCRLNPDHILLTDHPMGEVKTFVCAQVNMKDRIIPRYVFEIEEIVELFKKHNFHQKLKSVNYYPFHNFDNYDGEYRDCQHYNLVFSKV